MPAKHQPQVDQWITLFNNLEAGLADGTFEQLAHPDIQFIDPFHELQGVAPVQQALKQFTRKVQAIQFEVTDIAWSSSTRCFLRWNFSGQLPRSGPWTFTGITELKLDTTGRIILHRDHWDAAQHCYMRFPVLGPLLRWVRQRIAGGH